VLRGNSELHYCPLWIYELLAPLQGLLVVLLLSNRGWRLHWCARSSSASSSYARSNRRGAKTGIAELRAPRFPAAALSCSLSLARPRAGFFVCDTAPPLMVA
jgi:hypothetical protein